MFSSVLYYRISFIYITDILKLSSRIIELIPHSNRNILLTSDMLNVLKLACMDASKSNICCQHMHAKSKVNILELEMSTMAGLVLNSPRSNVFIRFESPKKSP